MPSRCSRTTAEPYTGAVLSTANWSPNHNGVKEPSGFCVVSKKRKIERCALFARDRKSSGKSFRYKEMARKVWADKSEQLLSNGSLPHPRQNVGIPPSRFCKSSSHLIPFMTVGVAPSPNAWRAIKADGVSSASGTPPE